MGGGDSDEDGVRVRAQLRLALQFVGKDVEQGFGIGAGVDVAQVAGVDVADEFVTVGEVAVMGEGDAVG